MLLSVPPKYSVSNVMGFIKGKSAVHIARVLRAGEEILLASIFGRTSAAVSPTANTRTPEHRPKG
jgi:REP element-mobilizing transposase RayT